MKHKAGKIDAALTEAVHEGLSSVSPAIPSLVLLILQKDGSIKSNNRIDDLEAFEDGLKRIFGFSAKVVERKILEAFYTKLQVSRRIKDDFRFAEEVKSVQKLPDSRDLMITKTH